MRTFSGRDLYYFPLKTLEAFYNLNQADFWRELCPEEKCIICVVNVLQRGFADYF